MHGALGEILLKEKKYADSVQELGLAVQMTPDSREYNLLLSEALIGGRHFDVAVNLLHAIQRRFGGYPEFHYDLGLAYYSMNKITEAKPEFQEALRLAPKLDRAEFLLAACLSSEGELAKAVDIYRTKALPAKRNTINNLTIPGLGTYTARVLLYQDQYAGTWSSKDHGGQVFGKIVRQR